MASGAGYVALMVEDLFAAGFGTVGEDEEESCAAASDGRGRTKPHSTDRSA